MLELPYQLLETLIEIDNQLGELALPAYQYGSTDDRNKDRNRRKYRCRIPAGRHGQALYFQGDITTEQLPDRRKKLPVLPAAFINQAGVHVVSDQLGWFTHNTVDLLFGIVFGETETYRDLVGVVIDGADHMTTHIRT